MRENTGQYFWIPTDAYSVPPSCLIRSVGPLVAHSTRRSRVLDRESIVFLLQVLELSLDDYAGLVDALNP